MVLHVLRGLFILLMAAVGWFYIQVTWMTVAIAIALAILFVAVDVISPRKKLAIFSGTLFGLVVGIAIAYALSFAVQLIVDQSMALSTQPMDAERKRQVVQFISFAVALICCYLSISFTLQTKDDFRFIVPYVEFSRKAKGARPMLLDTSVLIDGRIADIAATGIIDSQLVAPRFVLQELQAVADSGDRLKRNRGRRGLDVLAKLRGGTRAEVVLYEGTGHADEGVEAGVDERLIGLAEELDARVLTNDYNLNKVAQLRGVEVININDLANALKPVVIPGERMSVKLVKPGESAGQGVGYLDDGTMVVVEQGRSLVGQEVDLTVTSALQTSAGRMIFARLAEASTGAARKDAAPPRSTPVR